MILEDIFKRPNIKY